MFLVKNLHQSSVFYKKRSFSPKQLSLIPYLVGMKIFIFFLLVTSTCFLASAQNRYDIVIDEIMADPSPQVGLPNNEWIELKNISTSAINLQNFRMGDATGQSGPMPNFMLQPDSFVIVCTSSAVAAMSVYGNTISVTGFPSLDNNGDQLFLKAANGKIIHAVPYSISWYQNTTKANGGWTLEMMDTKNPCSFKNNWTASIDSKGGTPGNINSISVVNIDSEAPKLKRAFPTDSVTAVLFFDEPVDSLKAATLSNYITTGGLSFIQAITLPPLFNTVLLKTTNPLFPNVIYTITANNIADCKNNFIGNYNKAKLGLPITCREKDIVVNEILFSPKSSFFDFVEFYNRSNKIFDASQLFIANRNSSGILASQKQISFLPFLIFPEDYGVITENADELSLNYFVKNPDAVFTIPSLPSFPDNEGVVVLLNSQNRIIDEVKYKDDWHFILIDNLDGVSLERIDPDGISQDEKNWHSAASTAGFGTPSYKNSQYKLLQKINATITITPKIFSPDNDGRDDIASIQYKVTEPGFMANITIYDSYGKPIKYLVRNGTLGLSGFWNWDGLDERKSNLPIGTYLIFTEIFNLKGEKHNFKNAVVLAKQLN